MATSLRAPTYNAPPLRPNWGPSFKVKYDTPSKVTWQGKQIRMYMPSPRAWQMAELGQAGVDSIRARVAQGVGSNDSAMPALKATRRARWSTKQQRWVEYGQAKSYYAEKKQQAGLNPIRDLYGMGVGWTGRSLKRGRVRSGSSHMLDAMRVTSVSPQQARIDITTRDARMKARANEQRAPWFGFSGRDVRNLHAASQKIWGQNVGEFRVRMAGGGSSPVWMDPLGISSRQGTVANPRPTLAGQISSRLSARYGRSYGLGGAQ